MVWPVVAEIAEAALVEAVEKAAAKQSWPVQSSFISNVEYDPETATLTINMKNGRTYDYPNKTLEDALALVHASSPGSYYNANLKDQ
jgi:hypothetical protein